MFTHNCDLSITFQLMSPLKKKSEKGYMWGCGLCPHPHIYPFFLLAVVFSVDSTNIKHLVSRAGWINIDAALGSESVENYQWT